MRHRLILGDAAHDVWLSHREGGDWLLFEDDWHLLEPTPDDISLVVRGDTAHIHYRGRTHTVQVVHPAVAYSDETVSDKDALALAPMPGIVVSHKVDAGEHVKAGDALMVIESMKLETVIRAARDGIVQQLHFAVGASFDRDAVLVTLSAEEG